MRGLKYQPDINFFKMKVTWKGKGIYNTAVRGASADFVSKHISLWIIRVKHKALTGKHY